MPAQLPHDTIEYESTLGCGLTHREHARSYTVYKKYIDEIHRRYKGLYCIRCVVETRNPQQTYKRLSVGINNYSFRLTDTCSMRGIGVQGHMLKYHDTSVEILYLVSDAQVATMNMVLHEVLGSMHVKHMVTHAMLPKCHLMGLVRNMITTPSRYERSIFRGKIPTIHSGAT